MNKLQGACALLIALLLPLACATSGMQGTPVADPQTIICPTTIGQPTPTDVAELKPEDAQFDSETSSVMDYDSPPRPIKITRPQYPQEAFVKKVEGTVLVEILIDSTGRVAQVRVLESVPLLDDEAVRCTCQWIFEPAMKDGRLVPTIARAPVAFRIY